MRHSRLRWTIIAVVVSGCCLGVWLITRHTESARCHDAGVLSLVFSPDGRWLASGSADNTIKIWSANTRELVTTIAGHSGPVYGLDFSGDGRYLASGSWDGSVKIWNTLSWSLEAVMKESLSGVTALAWCPDANVVACGDCATDSRIVLWNIETNRLEQRVLHNANGINCLTYSPDGRMLASVGQDRVIKLWAGSTRTALKSIETAKEVHGYSEGVVRLAFSPATTIAASGGTDKTVTIWDTRTWDVTARLRGHVQPINALVFSPDGHYMASAGGRQIAKPGQLLIWRTSHNDLVYSVDAHQGPIWSVAISPDGRFVVSGGDDGEIEWRKLIP